MSTLTKMPNDESYEQKLNETKAKVLEALAESDAFLFISSKDLGEERVFRIILNGSPFEIIGLHQHLSRAVAQYLEAVVDTNTAGKTIN